jgi:ATP-dependent RNA helicase RhlE
VTTFAELHLAEPLLRAVAAANYETPTAIQAQAIPAVLEGRDLIACAQTGTGKTAAFALPILHRLAEKMGTAPPRQGFNGRGPRKKLRALVLSPTRELAAQIGQNFQTYSRYLNIQHHVVYGGVNQYPQVRALQRGLDVLVATPGRLLDLHNQGHVDLSAVEHFVLDEADRMLDMGFADDLQRIVDLLPKERQTLLFSATMPRSIVKLAGSTLKDPIRVDVETNSSTPDHIQHLVMFVTGLDKRKLIVELIQKLEVERAIVFTRTKHCAEQLSKYLADHGVYAAAIHGDKSQNARSQALRGFRIGRTPVLVATDVASRGIDVDDVSHVFNYELPNEPESYVHRIGRTGRAGRSGMAISFCDEREGKFLQAIERNLGIEIPVVVDHEYHCERAVPRASVRGRGRSGESRGGENRGRRGRPSRPSSSYRPDRQRFSSGQGSAEGTPNGEGNGARSNTRSGPRDRVSAPRATRQTVDMPVQG